MEKALQIVDVAADKEVFTISGTHWNRRMSSLIHWPEGRRIRFPVEAGKGNKFALMTGIDESGIVVAQYRNTEASIAPWKDRRGFEAVVQPHLELTAEIVCMVAFSTFFLKAFLSISGSGA